MPETIRNAGTGSRNRNYGHGKRLQKLPGAESTRKDAIPGSGSPS